MVEQELRPVSALAGVAVPGRHGVRSGPAGLSLRERDGLQIVSIAARREQDGTVAEAVRNGWGVALPTVPRFVDGKGVAFVWAGAGQWLAIAGPAGKGAVPLFEALREACGSAASLTVQGDGRAVLSVGGPAAREVLASVVSIDLHPRVFKAGDTALTLANHVGVQIRQLDDSPCFELLAFRAFGGSVFETVLHAGLPFGVEVLPPG